jgi:hypothetical protein
MTLANWRDLAVVFLALQVFVVCLVPAALLFLMVRGISWVLRQAQGAAPRVQGVFQKAARITDQASQRVAGPIIAADALATQVGRTSWAFSRWLRGSLTHLAEKI